MPEKALAKKRKRKKRKNTAAAEKTRSDDDSDVMPPPTSRRKQQHLQSLEKDQGPSVPGTPMVGKKTDVQLTTNTDLSTRVMILNKPENSIKMRKRKKKRRRTRQGESMKSIEEEKGKNC